MKAFVTGSTGFLGNNLVHLLLEQRYSVKALVRSPKKADTTFKSLPVTRIQGDMGNLDRFASELQGCDILFHCAAYFREYYQPGSHWEQLERINIRGTVKLLEAAEQAGIRKVIYISSAGIIGKNKNGIPGDETTPPNAISNENLYFKSKLLAEQAIEAFLQHHSLSVVSILPGWMFGPRDFSPTDSGRLVLNFLKQKLPGIVPGGTTVVDVRDVAQVAIDAIERGQRGERYLVAGTYLSMEKIFKTLAEVTGIPAPKQHLPYFLLLLLAGFSETYGRLSGKPILLSRAGIQNMKANKRVTSAKAMRELGVTFRPFHETLRDEVSWFQENPDLFGLRLSESQKMNLKKN
ncbi:MAG: SDR family oxidoreductase [Cyanobacteria bacterium SBC]|nr:SDR family oxidoreductase [Cyanobacteria bacterium SBC]